MYLNRRISFMQLRQDLWQQQGTDRRATAYIQASGDRLIQFFRPFLEIRCPKKYVPDLFHEQVAGRRQLNSLGMMPNKALVPEDLFQIVDRLSEATMIYVYRSGV